MAKELPHPAQFTKGSVWRFHTRRSIHDSHQHFEAGETITISAPLNGANIALAVREDIGFRCRSDETKYHNSRFVNGTVSFNQIYRFLEPVSAGEENIIYYLCSYKRNGGGYYYQGVSKDYPNVAHFSEARYWENRFLALKALLRLNRFVRREEWYDFYRLMAYDNLTDTHHEIEIPDKVREAILWMNKEISGRAMRSDGETAAATVILRNFDSFEGTYVVSFAIDSRWKELKPICDRLGLKPLAVADRYAFFSSLDDAMLLKMSAPDIAVTEVAC